jgi:hypothetical protein
VLGKINFMRRFKRFASSAPLAVKISLPFFRNV